MDGSSLDRSIRRRCTRRTALRAGAAGLAASTLAGSHTGVTSAQTATPAASPAAIGNVSGLVDIGGRSIYLECRGSGGPTVMLVSGYRASARYWTDDLLNPDAPRTMVLPEVAAFTHVCAYDRPGTYASIGDEILVSRSDALAQPRTVPDVVAELHALLQSGSVPGPYVLVGHSLGGFVARLYASTYPEKIVGLVLVDAYSERLERVMPPDRWEALKRLNQGSGTDTVLPISGYGDVETIPFGGDGAAMRDAEAVSPLKPMPLAVLVHGKPFSLPDDPEAAQGFTEEELEGYMRAADQQLVNLVPNARMMVASESGHDIHQDQPELVVEAIRQVVAGVRNPATWYDLASCCGS